MTRREWLALAGAAAGLRAASAPASPVVLARCQSYDGSLSDHFSAMFDKLGGLGRLVRGKTVTVKLNLTGSPGLRFEGLPLGSTHYTHPRTAGVLAQLLDRAGARRIRFVESCWATAGPLEEYLLDAGWNVRALKTAARNVEFENTNGAGRIGRYASFKVPYGGEIFPAYELNAAYEETDVYVSLAKLKDHGTCGITLSLKNTFGITPASMYGDDAGRDEPNERPTKGRLDVVHLGKRQPSRRAPAERDPSSSRDAGFRVPRVTVELAAARPIHLAIIDGVETVTGGEGPWIPGLKAVKPGVLIAGFNPVSTDAVAAAVMGYNPRATRGTAPFRNCDNTLLLAEARGLGSADLARIEVRGASISEVRFPFAA